VAVSAPRRLPVHLLALQYVPVSAAPSLALWLGLALEHELVVANFDRHTVTRRDPQAAPRLAWQRDLVLGADHGAWHRPK